MSSRPQTIKQSQRSNELRLRGMDKVWIATKISLEFGVEISPKREEEYLTGNSHSKNCPTCHGLGVKDRNSTGLKRPICDRV